MEFRLYMLCHRVEALVASQLDPEAFGAYMATGTKKQTSGKVLFFEMDATKIGDAFDMEYAKEQCVPHPDGRLKASKYISIYRVMERAPMEAFGTLFLTTRDGRVIGIEPAEYTGEEAETEEHLIQELCPINPLVAASVGPRKFTKTLTDTVNPVSVPKIFFVDLQIERDEGGALAGYLPYRDKEHVAECLNDVVKKGAKMTKTVDRRPNFASFFRTIRNGFYLGEGDTVKYYPMPSEDQLSGEYYAWWRSAATS